ncbi:hypothetical protein [Micromonospora sp. NPDC049171]
MCSARSIGLAGKLAGGGGQGTGIIGLGRDEAAGAHLGFRSEEPIEYD